MLWTWRWFLTIKVFRLLCALGEGKLAERWSEWSGLRAALEAELEGEA